MQIDHHDNSGFNGDAEESNVPHPHRHAEVIPEQPLKNQSSSHRVKRGQDEDHGFCDRVEYHIKKQKNHKENNRQNDFQSLLGPQLKFVLARPLIDVASRHLEFLCQQAGGLVHEPTVVFCVQIKVNIPGELAVFVADHGWAVRKINLRDLLDWDLCAGRGCNQYAAQLLDIIAEIPFIAHVHGISLTAFYVFTNIHASDTRRNGLLNVSNSETVFRGFRAVYFHIQIEALGHALGKNRAHLRKGREDLLELSPDLLNLIKGWTLDFHTNRRLDSRQCHIQTVFDRHRPSIRESGKLQPPIHLLNELFIGHPRPPLLAWFQHDSSVIHVQRRVVGCAVGTANSAKDRLHFGK